MRRFIAFLIGSIAFLGVLEGYAQSPTPIPVTGNLSQILGTPQPYAGVSLQLQNCAPPISIPGTGIVVNTALQVQANASGLVNTSVWPVDVIDCNGTTGASMYGVQYIVGGVPTADPACYQPTSTMGTWNLSTLQPITCTQTPPNPQDLQIRNLNVTGCISINSSTCVPQVYVSASATAPQVMAGPIGSPSLPLNVLIYGASTGLSDNSTAFNNAAAAASAAGGGVVSVPPGVWNTTHTVNIPSKVSFVGAGPQATVINFVPVSPYSPPTSQSAFLLAGTLTNRRQIAAAVSVGATSFTLASSSDGTDLTAGEWLIMEEYDAGAGPNQVISTWEQVLSVSGTTVSLVSPMRTAIPHLRTWNNTSGSFSGSSFYGVTSLVSGASIRDMKIQLPYQSGFAGNNLQAIYSEQAVRSLTIDNTTLDDPGGNAIAVFLSSDLHVTNNRIVNSHNATSFASEIAATSGAEIAGNLFGNFYTPNSRQSSSTFTAGLDIDNGTEFFSLLGNDFENNQSFGLELNTAAHNCSVVGNHFGFVSGSPGNAMGGEGVTNCYIAGNTGTGGAGFGVDLESTSGYTVNVTSGGNIVNPLGLNGFTLGLYRPATASPTDLYYLQSALGPVVPGSAASGLQIQYGNVGSTQDSSGAIASSGGQFSAFNAMQTASGVDNWTQINSAAGSRITVLDAAGGLCYYVTPSSQAAGTFAAFWGSAKFCVDASGDLKINGATVIPSGATGFAGSSSGKVIVYPAVAGSGAGVATGPTTSVAGHVVTFADTLGTHQDSGVASSSLPTITGTSSSGLTCWKTSGGLGTCTAGTFPSCSTCN